MLLSVLRGWIPQCQKTLDHLNSVSISLLLEILSVKEYGSLLTCFQFQTLQVNPLSANWSWQAVWVVIWRYHSIQHFTVKHILFVICHGWSDELTNIICCSDAATDYEAINALNNPLDYFTFINSTHRQCFNVIITDDKALETTEMFSLNLTIGNTTGQGLNITIDPNFSLVEIKDEDSRSMSSLVITSSL